MILIRQLFLPVVFVAAWASPSRALRGDGGGVPNKDGTTTTIDHGQPVYDAFQKAVDTMPEGERLLLEERTTQSRAEKFAALDQLLAERSLDTARSDGRSLQEPFMPTRDCGKVITVSTAEEITAMTDFYVDILFPNPSDAALASLARTTLFATIIYDVQITKICMSCSELKASGLLTEEQMTNDDRYGFGKYCNEMEYGYDAVHSSLLFWPIDPETGAPMQGLIRSIMGGHATTMDLELVPTESWQVNLTEYLATQPNFADLFLSTSDFLTTGVSAASGAIVVMPDYLGYGESYDYNRTYFGEESYCQSFVTGWFAAKKYVSETSGGCTEMEDTTTMTGYSEGGYASTVASFALRQLEVTIWGSYPGGTPFNAPMQFAYLFDLYAETLPEDPGTQYGMKLLVPLVGYSYSNEFSYLPNTGTGQRILTDEWVATTQDWFNSPSACGRDFVSLVPDNVTEIINPEMLAIFKESQMNGVANPCEDYVTDTTDKLCEAISEANLWSELASRTDFNTVICHSPNDDLVSFTNVPVFPFSNPMVTAYEPPLSFLAPTGNHQASTILCAISPLLAISQITMNGPIQIAELENAPFTCKDDTSVTPTPAPVPVTDPTPAPVTVSDPTPSAAVGAPRITFTFVIGSSLASLVLFVSL